MPSNQAVGLQVVDQVLTNIARRYESHGFIADQLLPSYRVQNLTGLYPVFDKNYWFANETDLKSSDRAPATEIDFKWDTESYKCERFALKVSITPKEREQAHPGLRLEQSKLDFLMKRWMIAKEVRIATLLRESTTGELSSGRTSTPSNNWNVDAATIEEDIKTGVLDVYDTIGYAPNTIVIPYKVAYAMAVQQDIREILKYTVNGQQVLSVGDRVLPEVLHGMRVIIPKGTQHHTANEGVASPTINETWGDDVRLLYIDSAAQWGTPTVAVRFVQDPLTIRRYRTDDPDIEYIVADEWVDEKVVAPDAAHVIKDVLS